MAFDGITMSAITYELSKTIIEARIDKIYQPDRFQVVLHIRKNRENFKLLLSGHPVYARICLIRENFLNPKTPPLFCMVLRKHLEGGKILSFTQPSLERVLKIIIENKTELGEYVRKSIIIETMGKHSNIILLNEENNKIIDSIKRVSMSTSQYRQVLPGVEYIAPPTQDKLNILEVSKEEFFNKILEQDLNLSIEKALLNSLMGFSPTLASQVTAKSGLLGERLEFCGEFELNRLWKSVSYLVTTLRTNTYSPVIILDTKGGYKAFSPFDIAEFHENNSKKFPTVNQAVDIFYLWHIKNHAFSSFKNNLQKNINHEIKRCEKKLALHLQTIASGKNSLQDKIFGELLTSNMHRIIKGLTKIEVENYYQNNNPVTIELLPELSPAQNAQRYFKRYNKSKRALELARLQAEQTKEEIAYLKSLEFYLSETSSVDDFEQIQQELIDQGYMKTNEKPIKKDKHQKPALKTFTSTEGFTTYIGRNNKQNDWLTFKIANENDLWFHVKDLPGAHVVLKLDGKKATDNAVLFAAMLAALHSSAKFSAKVPVDYTKIKYVKKIKEGKPGLVTYENFKTLFITPDEGLLKNMIKAPKQ
ncbi:MAG: NFACT RNA binding domain-containing protein [Bacillota bacterium]